MIITENQTLQFDYSDQQKMVAEAARAFAEQHIAPFVREWDDTQYFPVSVLKAAG